MATEPPQFTEPLPPPPVADRRAPERRGRDRAPEERTGWLTSAASVSAIVCGGLVIIFLFFLALGAFSIGNATGLTIAAIILALLWITGLLYRRRHLELRAVRRDRERRGF